MVNESDRAVFVVLRPWKGHKVGVRIVLPTSEAVRFCDLGILARLVEPQERQRDSSKRPMKERR